MDFFKNRPFALYCCAFVCAVAHAELLLISPTAKILISLAAVAAVFFAVALLTKRIKLKKALLRGAACLLCFGVGLSYHFWRCDRVADEYLANEEAHAVEAVLTEKLYESFDGEAYTAFLRRRDGERAGVPVLLTLKEDPEKPLSCGDIVVTEVVFCLPEESEVGFNEKLYLRAKGILVCANETDAAARSLPDGKISVLGFAARTRSTVTSRINAAVNGGDGGICAALLTGDRSGLSDMLKLDFSRAGTMHLLAISGMHFTCLMGAVAFLLKYSRLPKGARLVIMTCGALVYCGLAGFSHSVMRAAIMLLAVYAAYAFKRERDVYTALFLAVFAIFVAYPTSACSASLWLSAFATFGVVFGAEKLYPLLLRLKRRSRALYTALTLLAMPPVVSIFALICTLPVMWLAFGSVSLLSPVTTAISSPVVSALLYISVVFAVIGAPVPVLTDCANWLCDALIRVTEYFSDLTSPYSLLYPFVPFLIFATALLAAIAVLKGGKARKLSALLLIAVLAAFPVCTAIYENGEKDLLSVSTCNIGKNDLLLLSSAEGCLLVDMTDGYKRAASLAVGCAETVCRTELDALVLTRLTKAAIRMTENLGTEIRIRKVYYPEPTDDEGIEIEKELLIAINGIRAEANEYRFDSNFELFGTELWVHSEFAEHSSVPVRAVKATHRDRLVYYVSSGITSSAIIQRLRSEIKKADLLFIGGAGPKNVLPLHFNSTCTTVFGNTEARNEVSEQYDALLGKTEVLYSSLTYVVKIPLS